MDEKRQKLIEAQGQAAAALEAGQKLAARISAKTRGVDAPERPNGAALGALLGNPVAFWSAATVCETYGDGDTVEPLALATNFAAARLAVGDLNFARETLMGQATWAGVLAVKLAGNASDEKGDKAIALYKLAFQAQRQSAHALATAAALNRLIDADTVGLTDGE